MSGVIAMTGASGFVGGHLVARLLHEGRPLRILLRDPARFARSTAGDVEIVRGDLADPAALAELCRGADTLIHCAGLIAARSRAEFFAVNREGTARLVEKAATGSVRRVLLLSSLAAREPSLSDYAASKRAGEEALISASGGMSWAVLRPPAVYGPGDRATLPLVQQLSRRTAIIPASPDARASLIHVSDLAAAIVHAALDDNLHGQICEVHDGTPGGYGWPDLRQAAGSTGRCLFLPRNILAAAAGMAGLATPFLRKAPILTRGKVAELYHRDWVCRNNLLETRTDWQPDIRFDRGFAETLAWYREAGWLS